MHERPHDRCQSTQRGPRLVCGPFGGAGFKHRPEANKEQCYHHEAWWVGVSWKREDKSEFSHLESVLLPFFFLT